VACTSLSPFVLVNCCLGFRAFHKFIMTSLGFLSILCPQSLPQSFCSMLFPPALVLKYNLLFYQMKTFLVQKVSSSLQLFLHLYVLPIFHSLNLNINPNTILL
jgi:hypothetical protein